MGVQGLWSVLESTGQPVAIQSLRGKVLAVDVSIWLHQSVKGFRDRDGNPLKNAHLLGVFFRICKLLNYGIKPVFVFDGGVPTLKRQTMISRKQKKLEAQDNSEIFRKKLLSNLIRSQLQTQTKTAIPPSVLIQAGITELTSSAKRIKTKSPSKRSRKENNDEQASSSDEIDLEKLREEIEKNEKINSSLFAAPAAESTIDSDESSGDEEMDFTGGGGRNYAEHFSSITSTDFDNLPLEIQHEVLFEMQESKKTNSWAKIHEMPKDLQNFSSFQMDRLVKRRFLQKKIQSVQKEMGNRHIHVQNLDDLIQFENEMGFGSGDGDTEVVTEIIGSKEKGALLIKRKSKGDLASSKLLEVKLKPQMNASSSSQQGSSKIPETTISDDDDEALSNSSIESTEENKDISISIVDEKEDIPSKSSNDEEEKMNDGEEDLQLAKAIELSLMDAQRVNGVYAEVETLNDEIVPLNSLADDLKAEVKVHSHSSSPEKPARESSAAAASLNFSSNIPSSCSKFFDKIGVFEIPSAPTSSSPIAQKNSSNSSLSLPYKSLIKDDNRESSSETDDDDFEEVPLEPVPKTQTIENSSAKNSKVVCSEKNPISICIDHLKFDKDNDIFSDLFKEKPTEPIESVEEDNSAANIASATMVASGKLQNLDVNLEQESVVKSAGFNVNLESNIQEIDISDNNTSIENSTSSSAAQKPSVRMLSMDFLQAQEKLNNQQEELHNLMGAQDRIATSITDQMYAETQEILGLFGIPYVISPMEAEAQCAFLDMACITDGSITDDNDIFLFGGRRVYKNFFSQGEKPIEFFQYADIVSKLNLEREKLILLAILVGSDYTNGLEGVGPVLGLEILSEFPSNSTCHFEGLVQFREWWEEAQSANEDFFCKSKVKEKLRKLHLKSGFPNKAVFDAYMNPTVDSSTERFRWGTINKDALKLYAKHKFGWEEKKFDATLQPILKSMAAMENKERQLTLDHFITLHPSITGKRKIKSKRLGEALKKLKGSNQGSSIPDELKMSESDSNSEEEVPETSSSSSAKNRGRNIASSSSKDAQGNVPNKKRRLNPKPSTSNASNSSISNKKKRVRLPTSALNAVIPQKVQEETQKKINKLKAIELMKKK